MNEAARRTVAAVKARGPHRRRGPMPRALPPKLIEREYGVALATLVSRDVIREAFAPLLRELPALLERAKAERGDRIEVGIYSHELGRVLYPIFDANEGPFARKIIADVKARLHGEMISTAKIEELAKKFAERTSTHQRVQMNKQTRSVLGVDVFTADKGLRAKIQGFASENVALIKDITDRISGRVEKLVTRAITSGTLHKDLAKQLDNEFGYGERRSKLIARDQVGKLYGQINAARHKELGIRRFVWKTVGDERVRGDPSGKYPDADSSHYDLDGETFSYDDPPKDEDGRPMLPGEPILCRCWAEPVITDLLDDADEG